MASAACDGIRRDVALAQIRTRLNQHKPWRGAHKIAQPIVMPRAVEHHDAIPRLRNFHELGVNFCVAQVPGRVQFGTRPIVSSTDSERRNVVRLNRAQSQPGLG